MKPNKFLGQNFLNSNLIIEDIINAWEIKTDDIVLEVGPGKGILTEALLKKVSDGRGRVIAVEKDERLVEFLREKFVREIENRKLILISGDVLKIENLKLFENCKLKIENYKIIANIPYYITSFFLRKFLESDFQPTSMVLMIQKEVAQRIRGDKESILSLSVKAYGEPKIIKTVPARFFSPKPKVDSAILRISNISKKFFEKLATENFISLRTDKEGNSTETKFVSGLEQEFFALIKQGFSSKRKILRNNLETKNLPVEFSEKRAEDLSLEDWKKILLSSEVIHNDS